MKHYVDTSCVLSWLIEGNPVLSPLENDSNVGSSRLLWIEVSRALHRALAGGQLQIAAAHEARHNFARFSAGLNRIRLVEAVYRRAEGPYPVVVRTLDALHLASAEVWIGAEDPTELAIWSLDTRMNDCAAQLGYHVPLLQR